ncbi:MAG: hypothetical protein NTX05_08085 [Fusobacteria bacterium]|nr:hypothetical protein [Fusobacteriota bacterium]
MKKKRVKKGNIISGENSIAIIGGDIIGDDYDIEVSNNSLLQVGGNIIGRVTMPSCEVKENSHLIVKNDFKYETHLEAIYKDESFRNLPAPIQAKIIRELMRPSGDKMETISTILSTLNNSAELTNNVFELLRRIGVIK